MGKTVKICAGESFIMGNANLMVIHKVNGITYLTVSGTNVSLQFRTSHEVIEAMEAIKEKMV